MTLYTLLFMLLVYGYILLRGALLIGKGCEMLLLIYGPGFIAGILIPIVAVIPHVIVITASGTGVDIEEVTHSTQVGMGTLIGTSLML